MTSGIKKPLISVVIKALNEQEKIERTIRTSLAAIQWVGGEVILADSLSTDDTVAIGSAFPIRIVQLVDQRDRSCGIGAQLGYQYAEGEFIYILDGDMELSGEFLKAALELMGRERDVAGVGGLVEEMNLASLEYQSRAQRAPANMEPGEVVRLDGGGLYRRSAVEQIGYLTNRNLHSYEEFELAVRLRSAGWRLKRLPFPAVRHYGHTLPPYKLLNRRWRSGYVQGIGELLRSAIGKKHARLVMKELRELRLYCLVIFWWVALISSIWLIESWPLKVSLFAALLVIPFVAMAVKKLDMQLGVYSVIAWNYYTAGLLLGMFHGQRDPTMPIRSRIVATPEAVRFRLAELQRARS